MGLADFIDKIDDAISHPFGEGAGDAFSIMPASDAAGLPPLATALGGVVGGLGGLLVDELMGAGAGSGGQNQNLLHQFGAENLGGIESETVSMEDILAATRGVAEENIARFPEAAGVAANVAVEQGTRFDEIMSKRFFDNIARVLPNFQEDIIEGQRDILGRVTGVAESFLAGELPDDVRSEIERTRAERGIRSGLFGPARETATARDIDLSSLDLVQQGVNVATGAVAPLTSRLLSSALTLTPPVSDIPALFTAGLGTITPGATIPPAATISAGTSIGVANAQSAVAAQVSNANIALDLLQTQIQTDLNQQAIDVAKRGQTIDLFAGLIGGGAQIASLFA